MAMDQQETFNWLVSEKARLEAEVEMLRTDRDNWAQTAFDLAFKATLNNPAIREQIERAKQGEVVDASVLNFVLRGPSK